MGDGADLNPFRPWLGRVLHEEERSLGAVGIAFHHHGGIAQMWQKHGRHVSVVLQEVAFPDAKIGPERLAQVSQMNGPAIKVHIDLVAIRGNEQGNATLMLFSSSRLSGAGPPFKSR